jgi:hypothetical protein
MEYLDCNEDYLINERTDYRKYEQHMSNPVPHVTLRRNNNRDRKEENRYLVLLFDAR